MIGSYPREINVQNTIKDGLCYLQYESVSMKVFLLNMHKVRDFIQSGKAYTSFNLLRILIFFSTKTTGLASPEAVNVRKRQPWRNKVLVFWECKYRKTLFDIAISYKLLNQMYNDF